MCNCINCIKVKLVIKYRATKRLEVKIPKGGTKERESVARGGIRDNLGGRERKSSRFWEESTGKIESEIPWIR